MVHLGPHARDGKGTGGCGDAAVVLLGEVREDVHRLESLLGGEGDVGLVGAAGAEWNRIVGGEAGEADVVEEELGDRREVVDVVAVDGTADGGREARLLDEAEAAEDRKSVV